MNAFVVFFLIPGILELCRSENQTTQQLTVPVSSVDWTTIHSTEASEAEDPPGRSPVPAVAEPNSTMCQACQCPFQLSVRPFEIICKDQTTIPEWEEFLTDQRVEEIHLNFNLNELERVTPIRFVKNLQNLIFSHNLISFVDPYAIADLPSLKYLSLSHNKLQRIHPNAFMGHQHSVLFLEVLDLSHNELHSLDEDLFDCLFNLYELNLSTNPIKVFDTSTTAALNALHKLGKLDLSQTGIKHIPSGLITPIRTLDTLIVSGNLLESVPKTLQYATNLVNLNLNNNPIQNLTRESFLGLHRLETLNMSVMPNLTKIMEGTLSEARHLKNLFCSFNPKLKFISPWVLENEKSRAGKELRIVHLRQNSLITLAENTFPWRLLDVVDIEVNPFVCDCHLRWLRKLVIKDPELTLSLICKSPDKVKDQPLMHVKEEVFDVCDPQVIYLTSPYIHVEEPPTPLSTKIIVTSLLLCSGVLLISLTIYFLRKRHRDMKWNKKTWVHYSKAENNDSDF